MSTSSSGSRASRPVVRRALSSPRSIDDGGRREAAGSVAHKRVYKFFTRMPRKARASSSTAHRRRRGAPSARGARRKRCQGVRMDMTESRRASSIQSLWRDPRPSSAPSASPSCRSCRAGSRCVRRRARSPELQRGLDRRTGLTLSRKDHRIDVEPVRRARDRQRDYKVGKHAHSAREIESERGSRPAYSIVLRGTSSGSSARRPSTRPLAGERKRGPF